MCSNLRSFSFLFLFSKLNFSKIRKIFENVDSEIFLIRKFQVQVLNMACKTGRTTCRISKKSIFSAFDTLNKCNYPEKSTGFEFLEFKPECNILSEKKYEKIVLCLVDRFAMGCQTLKNGNFGLMMSNTYFC